jgi:UDPglucose--hexose-1-phosphate uridylyltransferase
MSEFRQDIISKDWVLFAPSRNERASNFNIPPATPDPKSLPKVEQTCVFCVSNDDLNKSIAAFPNEKDWKVRVIPNKYKALDHKDPNPDDVTHGFYPTRPGVGDHELVITRDHNVMTADLPDDLIDLTLRVYQERMNELSEHAHVAYVQIAVNHGRDAGASLLHPHSQIIAMPFVPDLVHQMVSNSFTYYHENGSCVFCDTIIREFEHKERVVLDQKDFFVVAPYASRKPYELRIIPKTHRAKFSEISTTERHSLAIVLKYVLQTLVAKFGNPAYNYYINTMPVSDKPHTKYDQKSYHWHLEVVPRMEVAGALELAAGVYVNHVLPEKVAEIFRKQ